MGDITIGGVNNVLLTGREDGPVVMLAHGFGCDQNMWRLVAPGLAQDFRLVLFDHVGSGRSDLSAWRPERYATLDGYADDVLRIWVLPRRFQRG
jgi:sigma-B regulation protein RsbQ